MSASSCFVAPASNVVAFPLNLSSFGDSEDGGSRPEASDRSTAEREDLPYKVELWDAARSHVEQVLAVTANGSIGYAAYFAATRENPDRYITLRHKNRIISRWNEPKH